MCHPEEAFVQPAAQKRPPELPPTSVTPPKKIASEIRGGAQARRLEAPVPAKQPEKKVEPPRAPERVQADTRAQVKQTLRDALEALMATERDETLPQRNQSINR